ncbi:hypothetical protein LUZ60_017357 [Juncus effusus]|nr:hypothetical protein LUZ60_017357 [Juncus effusus]
MPCHASAIRPSHSYVPKSFDPSDLPENTPTNPCPLPPPPQHDSRGNMVNSHPANDCSPWPQKISQDSISSVPNKPCSFVRTGIIRQGSGSGGIFLSNRLQPGDSFSGLVGGPPLLKRRWTLSPDSLIYLLLFLNFPNYPRHSLFPLSSPSPFLRRPPEIMASAVASPSSPLPHPWLSPRLAVKPTQDSAQAAMAAPVETDFIEFEFPSEEVQVKNKMLTADELFSNGKLLPLRPHNTDVSNCDEAPAPEAIKPRLSPAIAVDSDPYVFSPKAPSCSSRWRELLGLKKSQSSPNKSDPLQKQPSSLSKSSNLQPNGNPSSARSLKYFIHRNTRSDSALSLPLLHRDSDADSSVSVSARLSLSSSSSSDRSDDNPRLSLDSDRTSTRVQQIRARLEAARARAGRSPVRRPTTTSAPPPARGLSVDSPRMNASGKIVFQGLERSSSSPGSFNGGPRPVRSRNGMERSYSANVVRVTPVLNVPVCSLSKPGSVFGFFSPQKKDNHKDSSGLPQGRPGSSLARTGSKVKAVRD